MQVQTTHSSEMGALENAPNVCSDSMSALCVVAPAVGAKVRMLPRHESDHNWSARSSRPGGTQP